MTNPKINLQFFAEKKTPEEDVKPEVKPEEKGEEGSSNPAPDKDDKDLIKELTEQVSVLVKKNEELASSVKELRTEQEKFRETYKEQFGSGKTMTEDDTDAFIKKGQQDVLSQIISVKDYRERRNCLCLQVH